MFLRYNMEEPRKQRRQRAVLSCNDCRRRKLKCDRELPCNRCVKGNVADQCAYELETHSPSSEHSSQRPAKRQRQRQPTSRQYETTAVEAPRSHLDIPKLFIPSEFARSDITAQDRVKSLERQVALLEQQLVAQRSADIEAPTIAGPFVEEHPYPPASLRGFLKGGHYGSFYYGPSSPISIMASVSSGRVTCWPQVHLPPRGRSTDSDSFRISELS
jgi:hypothetical protein